MSGRPAMIRPGAAIVRHRVPILIVTGLVLGAAAVALPRLRIDASSRNLLHVDAAVRATFERYVSEWGGENYLGVTVEFREGEVFTAPRLGYLRALTDRLARIPGVRQAESLTSTTVLSASGDRLHVGPLVPDPLPTDAAALATVKARALASPLLRRLLLDDPGRLLAVNLRLRDAREDMPLILATTRQVRAVIDQVPRPPGARVRVIGGPVVVSALHDLTQRDLWVLSVAPFVLVGLLLLLLLRSVPAALVPLASVGATCLVTLGALAGTGHAVNLLTSMLPSLLMVIGVADVVHVVEAYRLELATHADARSAVTAAVDRLALPCFLTSFTTAVGFGSLGLADVPQVREFGGFAAVGVLVAFLLSLAAVPALLAVLPPLAARAPTRPGRLDLTGHLPGIARWARRWPVAVAAVTVGLAVLAGLGATRLRVESSALAFLPPGHPVLVDLHAVERRLAGTLPVVVHFYDRSRPATPAPAPAPAPVAPAGEEVIDDPEDRRPALAARADAPERLRDPGVLSVIDGLEEAMGRVPGVRKVISIAAYLREVNRVMNGGGAEHHRLPADRHLLAAYLEMAAAGDPQALGQLLSWDRSSASVTLMCIAPTSRAMQPILAALRQYLARPDVRARLGDDVAAEITGYGPLLAQVSDRIVVTQLTSTATAAAIISVTFMLLLWSVRVGLLAMIPNLLPILVTLGLMGWLGITLNLTTVMVAAVALGLAVDNTIHLLTRARAEVHAGEPYDRALDRTLAAVGRPVVHTTYVVAGGFAVLLLSALPPAREFGLLCAFTLLMALAADLVLTPLLVQILRPFGRSAPPRTEDDRS